MSEQASAGWYPDGQGSERYWDGAAWTDQTRALGTDMPKKAGAFSKLGAAVKNAAAEKKVAKEEFSRKQAEDAQAAGALVTSGDFGTSTIEIYENGYVRVSLRFGDQRQTAALRASSNLGLSTRLTRISANAPYEKFRSIKYTPSEKEQSSGTTSSLEQAMGPAVAGLIKGGRAAFKGSVPGLLAAGVSHVATAGLRESHLTIATDKQIHTLTNEGDKGHNEVGRALEAAGNTVLAALEPQAAASELPAAPDPQPTAARQLAASPTLSDRLRELAELHKDGILSDEEFAAAKGKLLSGL